MDSTVSLTIKQTEVPAQVLMYLKKQTGHSLSALQEKLRNHDFVITLSYYELESIERINQMRRDLMKFGLEVELYENYEPIDHELIENLEETYREDEEEEDISWC